MDPLEWTGLALVVFAASTIYDFAYARYTIAAAHGDRLRGAAWTGLVGAVGLVGFFGILKISSWLAAPELAGWCFGAYLGIGRRKP